MDDAHDQDRQGPDELELQPLNSVTKTRPKALWAALAAVVLAVGALAVTNLGDTDQADGRGQPIPISLLNGGGKAEAAASADSRYGWIQYEAGPDLPALGGEAKAYRLGTVTEAQVRQLAGVLGVTGDLHHQGGQWSLQDGEKMLGVSDAGAWYFNGAAVAVSGGGSTASDGCGPGADCAVAVGAPDAPVTTTTYDPCSADPVAPNVDCASTPPMPPETVPGSTDGTTGSSDTPVETTPPDSAPCAKVVSPECGTAPDPDLPSKDEARAAALELLGRTGTDVDGAKVTVDGGGSIWVVSVEPELDGRPSGLVAQALVGPKAEVQGANGFLGQPEALGTYPVLTTHATIDRTNKTMATAVDDIPVDSTTRDDITPMTATSGTVVSPCPGAAVEGEAVSCPAGPAPPMTTVTVTGCAAQPSGIEICQDPSTGVGTDGSPGVSDGGYTGTGDTCVNTDSEGHCTGSGSSGSSSTTGGDPGTGTGTGTGGVAPPPTLPPTPVPAEPASIVLVDAVPIYVLLGASDGSGDTYLVPGYRFTPEGGGQVDLVAISDDSIAGPPATNTTVPATDGTVEPPVTGPTDCKPLVEGDDTGTTHTIQPCPPVTSTTAQQVEPDAGTQTTVGAVAEP